MSKQTTYEKAVELGLTKLNRWEDGIEHHDQSVQLMEFLKEHDYKDNGDYFCFKLGGDGDNGETLMYLMDAFFEARDAQAKDILELLGINPVTPTKLNK
jgi:hypothetical protein